MTWTLLTKDTIHLIRNGAKLKWAYKPEDRPNTTGTVHKVLGKTEPYFIYSCDHWKDRPQGWFNIYFLESDKVYFKNIYTTYKHIFMDRLS